MQGVAKAYDPVSRTGVVMCDTDLNDYELAANALDGSVLRMLRQGQRVIFDLDDAGRATAIRLGSEVDMQHARGLNSLGGSPPGPPGTRLDNI